MEPTKGRKLAPLLDNRNVTASSARRITYAGAFMVKARDIESCEHYHTHTLACATSSGERSCIITY
ncbi:hypothetical protein L915_00482 [Phytophthora nicotianae]|uniref:Uncharacterized protein n=1 Tax=Phytophthora nicotianae TaxID=4792 RepID=W2HP01_PHYNI|nr:hypothetical protein L915_00482 [Phytophthora nicotianae]ETL50237.1 hypothetical protein L916_00484 [Phytophthora nicotianae]